MLYSMVVGESLSQFRHFHDATVYLEEVITCSNIWRDCTACSKISSKECQIIVHDNNNNSKIVFIIIYYRNHSVITDLLSQQSRLISCGKFMDA